MPIDKQPPTNNVALRATGWAGAVLAAFAVVGLLVAPSLRLVWIVLLVFAVAAVPQAFAARRRRERRERHGR